MCYLSRNAYVAASNFLDRLVRTGVGITQDHHSDAIGLRVQIFFQCFQIIRISSILQFNTTKIKQGVNI